MSTTSFVLAYLARLEICCTSLKVSISLIQLVLIMQYAARLQMCSLQLLDLQTGSQAYIKFASWPDDMLSAQLSMHGM